MALPKNIGTALSEALLGLPCTRIEHPSDWFWQIGFGDNIVVFGIESPWRLLFKVQSRSEMKIKASVSDYQNQWTGLRAASKS